MNLEELVAKDLANRVGFPVVEETAEEQVEGQPNEEVQESPLTEEENISEFNVGKDGSIKFKRK